ncbi:YopX family protein [Campylobacter coli]
MKLIDFDFRIWSVKKEKYLDDLYNNIISLSSDKSIKGYNRNYKILAIEFSPYDSIPLMNDNEQCFEIELFTGYYDYKGNKIYIGDIIECLVSTNEKNSEIFYEIICFDMELGLCSKLSNGDGGYLFDLRRHKNNKTIEDVYVVGNIHENKELLKG